jgi:HEAT repeat protein
VEGRQAAGWPLGFFLVAVRYSTLSALPAERSRRTCISRARSKIDLTWLEGANMTFLRLITFTICVASLHGQALRERAWSILVQAAQDQSYEKRGKAIHSLGMITGNAKARTLAETALADEHEDVRVTAADVLGLMRAKESAPKLKVAIMDKQTGVVFAATNALFVMGDPAAFQVYYAVLTGQKKSGDALVEAQLKMLKDPKALSRLGLEAGVGFIPFGGVSYKVFKMATADTVSPVRAAAAMKLAGDPDPKTVSALADVTKDEKWLVRAAAVGALARRSDPSAIQVIKPLLDDENDVVRFNAAAAIIQLSSPTSAKPPQRKK